MTAMRLECRPFGEEAAGPVSRAYFSASLFIIFSWPISLSCWVGHEVPGTVVIRSMILSLGSRNAIVSWFLWSNPASIRPPAKLVENEPREKKDRTTDVADIAPYEVNKATRLCSFFF